MKIQQQDNAAEAIITIVTSRDIRLAGLKDAVLPRALKLSQDVPNYSEEHRFLAIVLQNIAMGQAGAPKRSLLDMLRALSQLCRQLKLYVELSALQGVNKTQPLLEGLRNSAAAEAVGMSAIVDVEKQRAAAEKGENINPGGFTISQVTEILMYGHPTLNQPNTQERTADVLLRFCDHVLSAPAIAATAAQLGADLGQLGAPLWARYGVTETDQEAARAYASYAAFGLHARAACYALKLWDSPTPTFSSSMDLGSKTNDGRVAFFRSIAATYASWEIGGWYDVLRSLQVVVRHPALTEAMRSPTALGLAARLAEAAKGVDVLPTPPEGYIPWADERVWEADFTPVRSWATATPPLDVTAPAAKDLRFPFLHGSMRVTEPRVADVIVTLAATMGVEAAYNQAHVRSHQVTGQLGMFPPAKLDQSLFSVAPDYVPREAVEPEITPLGLPRLADFANVMPWPSTGAADRAVFVNVWASLTASEVRSRVRALLTAAENEAGLIVGPWRGNIKLPLPFPRIMPVLRPWSDFSSHLPPSKQALELLTGQAWDDIVALTFAGIPDPGSWPARASAEALRMIGVWVVAPKAGDDPLNPAVTTQIVRPFSEQWYFYDLSPDSAALDRANAIIGSVAGVPVAFIPFGRLPINDAWRGASTGVPATPGRAPATTAGLATGDTQCAKLALVAGEKSPYLPFYRLYLGQLAPALPGMGIIGGWKAAGDGVLDLVIVETMVSTVRGQTLAEPKYVLRLPGDAFYASVRHAMLESGGTHEKADDASMYIDLDASVAYVQRALLSLTAGSRVDVPTSPKLTAASGGAEED